MVNDDVVKVYVGYDPVEALTFHVLSHSVNIRSSLPVSISPIMLSQLNKFMWRDRDPLQSNDFSFSRFLVPYLSNYEGWSIFMDCDMIVLEDIVNLWNLRDDKYAVMVVKHNHIPTETKKYLGTAQTPYAKKNWSSVMLINNAKCKALTPEYVNSSTGLELHQFKWLESDDLIGEIPSKWNHLVDYDENKPSDELALLHYTKGGPYFKDYKNCPYSKEWFSELGDMLRIDESIDLINDFKNKVLSL